MSNHIIKCPKCDRQLRMPDDHGRFRIRCTECTNIFVWDSGAGVLPDNIATKPSPKSRGFLIKSAIGIALLMLIVLFLYFNKDNAVFSWRHENWTSISYAKLVDTNQIIRTGQTLKSALPVQNLKGAIQPFLDSYSSLLMYAIEMLKGPDKLPHQSVVDYFPASSEQPAWVAIFRGGRILVSSNNIDHARVFLLGKNPQKAYLANYSIIRHSLNGLVPSDGSELTVEIYAYQNNYRNLELRLNTNPYILRASSFPSKKTPLDLNALADFFDQGPELQGAELDPNKGLILYGKKGSKQTLSGQNISLSDFAVAYRAAFHAGDNEAYVSLDPHMDPTKVTVNFGGFLEDTMIGKVVLEADKRFKTISSGLDPNSFKDLRRYTRSKIPSFMTENERDMLNPLNSELNKWIGTRYWFYPDSIKIESDLDYKFALIIKPQFMADAERSREDFNSPEEFEKKKKNTLPPSTRKNINHLNQKYNLYANAFSEISELSTVARLMGLSSWLQKANPAWLDLDVLLSVKLPPVDTISEKTKMLSVTYLRVKSEGMAKNYAINDSKVIYLSPILDMTLNDYFKDKSNFAKYLSIKEKIDIIDKNLSRKAYKLFTENRYSKVSSIIDSRNDLKVLAKYASKSIDIPQSGELKSLKKSLSYKKNRLTKLNAEISAIKIDMNYVTGWEYNQLVDKHNNLIKEYRVFLREYNQDVETYNNLVKKQAIVHTITGIGGGINLEPRNFKINKMPSSPKLKKFKDIARGTTPEWKQLNGAGTWIRSKTTKRKPEFNNVLPKREWKSSPVVKVNDLTLKFAQADSSNRTWLKESQGGSWRELVKVGKSKYLEKSYNKSQNKLQIVEFKSGRLNNYVTGHVEGNGRIVFQKGSRTDLMSPQEPPIWWSDN